MKKFGYGDVPRFLRAGAVEQFKVFYYIQYEVIVRKMVEPYHEVYHEPQQFYNCVMCGNKDYYTAPYCTSCLAHKKCMLLSCDGVKENFKLSLLYIGCADCLEDDYSIWNMQIDAEIMTEEAYHIRFKETFRLFGMVGAIKLPLQTIEEEADGIMRETRYYLVYLEIHCLLAAMETSMDPSVYNVELTNFTGDGDKKGPSLRVTRTIPGRNSKSGLTKLVLRAHDRYALYHKVEIEPDIKKWETAEAICSEFGIQISSEAELLPKDQLDFDDE
jgi:hypothetical protein